MSESRSAAIAYGTEHPHEPEIAPVLDAEGGCLVCAVSVRDEEIAFLRAELAKIGIVESYRRAVAILADEAEAYLSAVGDEDDASDRIAWAVRRVKGEADV